MSDRPDISVLIATRDRAASLAVTLECLAQTDREGLGVELVVIDNGGEDNTREVAESFRDRIAIRYLREETPGKASCLNRALVTGGLGHIVAVLDDDMSPAPEWCRGVASLTERWPDKDIFSGSSHVVWPLEDVPGWARRGRFHGWLFSVMGSGPDDRCLDFGRWPSGNHIWFRSRVLSGRRFRDTWSSESEFGRDCRSRVWNSDARFVLDLMDDGYEAVVGPDAVAGHRVQPGLLDEAVVRRRAMTTGQMFASTRLDPCRQKMKHARLMHAHPLAGRTFCLLQLARWSGRYLRGLLRWRHDTRFEQTVHARHFFAYYREMLRVAAAMEEYRILPHRHPPDHTVPKQVA